MWGDTGKEAASGLQAPGAPQVISSFLLSFYLPRRRLSSAARFTMPFKLGIASVTSVSSLAIKFDHAD